jgi:hypothetical protein
MMNKRRLPAYNLLRTLFSVGAAFVFGAFLQPLGLPELLFVAVASRFSIAAQKSIPGS